MINTIGMIGISIDHTNHTRIAYLPTHGGTRMRGCLDDIIQHDYKEEAMDESFKKDTVI